MSARRTLFDPLQAVQFTPGTQIDLGGIVKGWTVDRLADRKRRNRKSPPKRHASSEAGKVRAGMIFALAHILILVNGTDTQTSLVFAGYLAAAALLLILTFDRASAESRAPERKKAA